MTVRTDAQHRTEGATGFFFSGGALGGNPGAEGNVKIDYIDDYQISVDGKQLKMDEHRRAEA